MSSELDNSSAQKKKKCQDSSVVEAEEDCIHEMTQALWSTDPVEQLEALTKLSKLLSTGMNTIVYTCFLHIIFHVILISYVKPK